MSPYKLEPRPEPVTSSGPSKEKRRLKLLGLIGIVPFALHFVCSSGDVSATEVPVFPPASSLRPPAWTGRNSKAGSTSTNFFHFSVCQSDANPR